VTVQVVVIGSGQDGVVGVAQSFAVVDAITGKGRSTVVLVVLSEYAGYELLQVVQNA
jgi:hypothetical protein